MSKRPHEDVPEYNGNDESNGDAGEQSQRADHHTGEEAKKRQRLPYNLPFKPKTDMTIFRAVVKIVGDHFKHKGKKIPLHCVSKFVPRLKHEFVDELQFVSTVMYALHDLHQLHAADGEWIAHTALNGDTNDSVHCGYGLFEGEDAIRDSLPNIGKDYILLVGWRIISVFAWI